MSQHFLMSAAARTVSLKQVARMTDGEARALFRQIRWPETNGAPVCPHCGSERCYSFATRPVFKCAACRRQFSETSGTLFAWRKLPIRDYLIAIVIFVNAVKGISALQLGRDLDVQYKTAYVLAHKLREAMAAEVRGVVLGGDGADVEVDGCYVGGHVRPENRKEDRKDRRLAENQNGKRQVVVVARERDGRTVTQVFGSEEESVAFIKARVDRNSTVHADEAAGWNSLHARFNMKRINHQEAYSADDACTNQAESYFARLRRAQWGQYHRIGGKYLTRYAAEMAWREDQRRTSNGEQFRTVGFGAAALPPSVDWCGYWQRIRVA
ncbi:IS1595 family transposase [Skermanella sp. TT6]|uniref:IS1595 family transposase n=1 Tax=Skermanella cutis TaxID=2775420 RepID=A0ABX7B4Y4_9PROT|nr:IS1595 family transposase [Skermanella sp. TT6]QQP88695.1 IS1595 family transposase [Skermanella sp. TT6]